METKQDFINVDARNTSTTIRVKTGDKDSDYYEINLHLTFITVYNIGMKLSIWYNKYLSTLQNYRSDESAEKFNEI
jgi:hypothetical protein